MKNTKKKNGAAKGKGRAALTAQQTIPYLSMHPDGVCKLPGGLYTKTVEYEDINYSVASTEDQTAIFSGWSSFLNYFDSSLPFQLSFINRRSHSRSRYQVNIPKADDNYNSVRDEFTGMLKNQIAKSNNGIERSKYITFAPDSPHHLNPMDVELNMAAGESPLSMKADFLLSLCELVVGGKEGLQPIEKTVIDRCVRLVYREQALGLETAKTPLLQDLYEELLRQPEPEARRVATALELYCTGSLNLFNHPTNVKTDSRVVCIVLKNMGENLRKIAMHITNEFVSQAVDQNFHEGAATWCYFDEFHILLRDPLTASYFVAVWKMLRKKGCVPSALTQNVKDLLASREIENILDNTDFMILLSQAQSDRTILAKQLGISEHQLSYITHSNSGEGLLFYGNVTIPFVDRFPRGEIYDLLTTRPEDMKNETKNE